MIYIIENTVVACTTFGIVRRSLMTTRVCSELDFYAR